MFTFFSQPEKFAYLSDGPVSCDICNVIEQCIDVSSAYSDDDTLQALCQQCIRTGKAAERGLEFNDTIDNGTDDFQIITTQTPSLPTWQALSWPLINGRYPVFDSIASKQSFRDETQFAEACLDKPITEELLHHLWEELPDKPIKHLNDAGHCSVYLFRLNGQSYWLWDAN